MNARSRTDKTLFTAAGDMRAIGLVLATILVSPGAAALALLPGEARVIVDLPGVSPVDVTRPAPPERRDEPLAAAPPPLPAPQAIVDDPVEAATSLDAPFVSVSLEPPEIRRPTSSDARLTRADRLAQGLSERAPVTPPDVRGRIPDPSYDTRAFEPTPERAPAESAPRPADPARPVAVRAKPPAPPAEPASPARALAPAALALLLAASLLYHRLSRGQVEGQQTRAKLIDLLGRQPGATKSEIARALGVDASTAGYHAHVLAREGLLAVADATGRPRYFLAGAQAPAERDRLAVERAAGPVLDAIRQTPGATKSQIARGLDIARTTLNGHLAHLEKAGLVRLQARGREILLYPQESFS